MTGRTPRAKPIFQGVTLPKKNPTAHSKGLSSDTARA